MPCQTWQRSFLASSARDGEQLEDAAAAAMAVDVVGSVPVPPNLILLLTDDQDLLFDSMRAMPFTTSVLGAEGATFDNFFAHTPVYLRLRPKPWTFLPDRLSSRRASVWAVAAPAVDKR